MYNKVCCLTLVILHIEQAMFVQDPLRHDFNLKL
jgi:hypothetical protein